MLELKIKPLVDLWKHQADGVLAATTPAPRSYAFFFDVGTGKSCTLLNTLRHLYAHENGLVNTLILAPIAVLQNWKREISIHTKAINNVEILQGSSKERIKRVATARMTGAKKIFVTNYEIMINKDFLKELIAWGPKVLVCDESQKLKTYNSARTKAVTTLADKCPYKYLLSGSPITNSPMDIFSQYRILDGGKSFGDNFFVFRQTWFYDANASMPSQKHFPDWKPRPGLYKNFNDIIYRQASKAVKSECLDLPPFIRTTRQVSLSPEQSKMYEYMKRDWVAYLEKEGSNPETHAFVASIALTKALRLQQIVSGFCVDDEGKTYVFDKNPRLDLLQEMLQEMHTQHKIIVWACFKENYRAISKILEGLKIPYRMLIGGMSDKDRNASINEFESDPTIRVMVANQSAGGVGINLVSSDVSIYFSKNYSLEQDIQSEARNYRGGSSIHKKVTRIDLVASETIDEVINEALAHKQNVADAIMQWKGRK